MQGFLWLKHGLHHGAHPHRAEAFGRWLHQPAVIGFLVVVTIFAALLLLAICLPAGDYPIELPYGYPGL